MLGKAAQESPLSLNLFKGSMSLRWEPSILMTRGPRILVFGASDSRLDLLGSKLFYFQGPLRKILLMESKTTLMTNSSKSVRRQVACNLLGIPISSPKASKQRWGNEVAS